MKSRLRPGTGRMSLLVTAGPTREKIDPVRFISNYSTGVFGYEIAREAKRRGHRVTLISGPACPEPPPGVKIVEVESALDMGWAVKKHIKKCDCLIMAAAISDWRAASPSKRKIKRGRKNKKLELVENPDILRSLGKMEKKILVGFALETERLADNAAEKLKKKNLDLVIANKIGGKTSPFGRNPTEILMLDRFGNKSILRNRTKRELARLILDKVSELKLS